VDDTDKRLLSTNSTTTQGFGETSYFAADQATRIQIGAWLLALSVKVLTNIFVVLFGNVPIFHQLATQNRCQIVRTLAPGAVLKLRLLNIIKEKLIYQQYFIAIIVLFQAWTS